jgi:hypothetical protein
MAISTPDGLDPSDPAPAPTVTSNPDIPDEAYAARTAARWLEPGQPLDPRSLADISRINTTRAQELETQYMGRQREILSTGPEAFLNKRSRDALLSADDTVAKLEAARRETLAQAANKTQRDLLQQALDQHGITAHADIGTHVGRQSLEWQKEVAAGRLASLIAQANLDYSDPARIKAQADAGEAAALDRSWASGLDKQSKGARAQSAAARSAVIRSAIEGALANGESTAARKLYEEVGGSLLPEDDAVVGRQIEAAQERATARNYLDTLSLPSLFYGPTDLKSAHQAATARNNSDWPDSANQRATNQHLLDVQFGNRWRDLLQARAELSKTVQSWLLERSGDGQPQTERPPLNVWTRLSPEDQSAVDAVLAGNATGSSETPDNGDGLDGHGSNFEQPSGSDQSSNASNDVSQPVAAGTNPAGGVLAPPVIGEFGEFGPLAARVASLASTAASRAMIALPFLVPLNSGAETVALDDGLRARIAPGQRTVEIERRVDKGLLGTGIGARWESLPIDAEIGAGPDGKRALLINPSQLTSAVGDAVANRIFAKVAGALPSLKPPAPPVLIPMLEIRIGERSKGATETIFSYATERKVSKLCPSYPRFKVIAEQASINAQKAGFPNGKDYGNYVHQSVKIEVRKMAAMKDLLEQQGVRELQSEVALLGGQKQGFMPRGASRLDILELYENEKAVCVYDVKTGGAVFPDKTMERYAQAAADYMKFESLGYTTIYVVPIHVP